MLQRRDIPVRTYAFLIAVDVQDEAGPSQQQIVNAFSDAVKHMEGTGETDVTPLGLLEDVDEEDD